MADDTVFDAWINPLVFREVDEPLASLLATKPDYEAVVRFLCAGDLECDLEALVSRYREISQEPKRLFAAPAEERILAKLVWPLRYAKGSYMVGNYLGTISLCGVVCEMIAILLFEISDIVVNGRPMARKDEVGLFGQRFEKLRQERRVQVLHTYNLIDDALKASFDVVRTKRNRYLHLYSQDLSQLAADAREVFWAAVKVVVTVIGQDVRDGKIVLNPALVRYLQRKGIAGPPDEAEDGGDQAG